jgi:ABC-2 type transport system permease protein
MEMQADIKGLLKVEWYKLRHSKPFFITLIIVAIQTIIQIGLVHFINSSPIAIQQNVQLTDMYSFAPVGQNGVLMIGSASLVISICLAAFTGLFVASEFQNNTIRASLALGKNRIMVYVAKLLSVCIAVMLFILLVTVLSTVGLSLLYGFGEMPLLEYGKQLLTMIATQMKLFFTFASVFCMIAFLCRNSGITIVLSAAYVLATSILMSFLATFDALAFLVKGLPQYYIMLLSASAGNWEFIVGANVVSLFYILIPCIIGFFVFKRVDVK